MALQLPRFQAGRPITDEVTAEKLNQIVEAIRQCELQSGVGYDVIRGPGGATLAIRRDNMIPSSQIGASYVIGPPSTGVAQDGSLIGPGQPTPAWSVKRPSSDVFEPIYVFGEYNYWHENIPVSCSSVQRVYARTGSGIVLTNSDFSRFSGVMAPYQGQLSTYWYNSSANRVLCDCSGPNTPDCVDLTDDCGDDWRGISEYFNPGQQFSAAGSFGNLTDGCSNFNGETGNYIFRCSFDIGQINPSQIKIRFRLRTNNVNSIQTSVFAIQLNSQAANFSPSGSFETDAGFNETREISDGFVSGVNTFDVVLNHPTARYSPGLRCQFEPTTALIVARDNSGDVANFSSLTDAQIDLIGQGTPVRALSSGTAYIWSYSGSGDKRSSSSYTRLQEA